MYNVPDLASQEITDFSAGKDVKACVRHSKQQWVHLS